MIQKVRLALDHASHAAQFSPDAETKVGAILLDEFFDPIDRRWNSFISGHTGEGLPNTRPHKYSFMLHAERRLLFNCARNGIPTDGRYVVCTLSPCPDCLRALWESGIRKVFFRERYREIDASLAMTDLHILETELENDIFQWNLSIR